MCKSFSADAIELAISPDSDFEVPDTIPLLKDFFCLESTRMSKCSIESLELDDLKFYSNYSGASYAFLSTSDNLLISGSKTSCTGAKL